MPLRCTSRAGGLWLTFCLLLAAIFAVRAGLDSSPDGHPLQALANGAAVAVEARAIGEQPIESIRVGQRVIAHNPLPDSSARTSDAEVGVDAATWRLLRLRAEERWPDGTLDVVEVETLQPPEWVAAHRARPGAWVPLPLDLLEMGLPETLRARVIANEPCPDIPAGPGSVVLTTVNHLNPELYELTLAETAGRESSARPTGLHKFYSEDRGAWTNTRDLRPGERLRSIDGPLTVERLTRVPGVHRVYNLTVAGEHVYHVSSLGLLSHNNVPCAKRRGGENPAAARGRQAHKEFAEKVKNKPGWQSETRIKGTNLRPDAIDSKGRPVELKPNTPSGRRQGRRQMKKYKEATGTNGRVIYYDP
jgi:hypothetical protein